jgi:hypothetical protein
MLQLIGQEATAWARIDNSRNAIHALEKGHVLLDPRPYPERPENHFVVDPGKFDFYAMDCYSIIGEDRLAEILARETLRKAVASDGTDLSPMRKAGAEITLGVIAARSGAPDEAVTFGYNALSIGRCSHPTRLMVSSERAHILRDLYPDSAATKNFCDALKTTFCTTYQEEHT